jgi:hypothetical protein
MFIELAPTLVACAVPCALRLRCCDVCGHKLRWVFQECVFPFAQMHFAFDEAAHDADVIRPAHTVATDQYVVFELKA